MIRVTLGRWAREAITKIRPSVVTTGAYHGTSRILSWIWTKLATTASTAARMPSHNQPRPRERSTAGVVICCVVAMMDSPEVEEDLNLQSLLFCRGARGTRRLDEDPLGSRRSARSAAGCRLDLGPRRN